MYSVEGTVESLILSNNPPTIFPFPSPIHTYIQYTQSVLQSGLLFVRLCVLHGIIQLLFLHSHFFRKMN